MAVSVANYNNISSDTGQDKKGGQSLWRIAIPVLTLDKIKMTDNRYEELEQYQCWQWAG